MCYNRHRFWKKRNGWEVNLHNPFRTEEDMTEGGFLVFMGILLLLVVIVVVIAVVSSVAGAAAAIVDDEDGEDE